MNDWRCPKTKNICAHGCSEPGTCTLTDHRAAGATEQAREYGHQLAAQEKADACSTPRTRQLERDLAEANRRLAHRDVIGKGAVFCDARAEDAESRLGSRPHSMEAVDIRGYEVPAAQRLELHFWLEEVSTPLVNNTAELIAHRQAVHIVSANAKTKVQELTGYETMALCAAAQVECSLEPGEDGRRVVFRTTWPVSFTHNGKRWRVKEDKA